MGTSLNQFLPIIGIIAAAWLSYLATTYKFRKEKPKDPQQELFGYYEQMLKNVWEQSREKDKLIDKLEISLDKITKELWETKQLLIETKNQLSEASRQSEVVQKNITDARTALNQES